MTLRILCAISIVLLIPATSADEPALNEPVTEPSQEAAKPEANSDLSFVDEVIVKEQRNVSQLRIELARTDDRLFSLYNTLNTDDSLDMICKKETRIGSQIKYRVCKSAYHRELQSDSGSDFLSGDDASTTSRAPAGHYEKVRSNLADLMEKHPELQKAFYERALLRKKIVEQKGRD